MTEYLIAFNDEGGARPHAPGSSRGDLRVIHTAFDFKYLKFLTSMT